MGLIKGMKDMVDMVNAAPDLIESSQKLAANAQAQAAAQQAAAAQMGGGQGYVNNLNQSMYGEPDAKQLEPIAGVTLETYTKVVKGIGAYGNDQSKLPQVASSFGVKAADWDKAAEGWGARIKADRAVGSKFNTLYTTS